MIVVRKAIAMILALIAQQQAEMKNFRPLGEITGTDTTIERPMALMVTDQRQMIQVWRQHKDLFGEPPVGSNATVMEAQVPVVDFKKNVVFAYFAGQTQGIAGYEIASVDPKGKTASVVIAPQTFPGGNLGGAFVGNSFGMWIFPKPTKPVELKLLIGFDQGKPVTRTLSRFEPPKPDKPQSGG